MAYLLHKREWSAYFQPPTRFCPFATQNRQPTAPCCTTRVESVIDSDYGKYLRISFSLAPVRHGWHGLFSRHLSSVFPVVAQHFSLFWLSPSEPSSVHFLRDKKSASAAVAPSSPRSTPPPAALQVVVKGCLPGISIYFIGNKFSHFNLRHGTRPFFAGEEKVAKLQICVQSHRCGVHKGYPVRLGSRAELWDHRIWTMTSTANWLLNWHLRDAVNNRCQLFVALRSVGWTGTEFILPNVDT